MEIAVLGWGSLIWCPGSLQIKTKWRSDGPPLPIEFARISMDGRLTLVLHPGSDPQLTYWAMSVYGDLEDARENLKLRESTSLNNVHYMTASGEIAQGAPESVVARIGSWLETRQSFDVVIWTGLTDNWREKRNQEFSVEDAVRYLGELEAANDRANDTFRRAKEYVRNAPPLVQTAVRREMKRKGWSDAALSSILFEL